MNVVDLLAIFIVVFVGVLLGRWVTPDTASAWHVAGISAFLVVVLVAVGNWILFLIQDWRKRK
jgi:hypothetical protein